MNNVYNIAEGMVMLSLGVICLCLAAAIVMTVIVLWRIAHE